jgi:hypothetical protein
MSNQSLPPVSQAVPPVDDVALKLQAVIAEYSSLRDEISDRSRDQLVCVTASLVGIGALLSTVATDPVKFSGLLVVAPWLLAVFGILWCDYAHGIHLAAMYIRDEIEQKKLPQLLGGATCSHTIGWETYLQTKRDTTKLLGYINVVLPLLYFVLPSVVVIIAYFLLRFRGDTALPLALEYSFVGLGVFLLAALLFSWRRAFRLT